MAKKTYSEQELLGKTKLGLRDICNELGIAFDNGKSIEELVKMILKQQGKGGHTADDDEEGGDDDDEATGSVTVTCGASSNVFQVAGKSIAFVRKEYASLMNIGRESKAMLNGKEQNDESHILKGRDNLEFVKKSGDKA